MNKLFKKTIAIILLVAIIFTNTPIYVIAAIDTTGPSVVITGINSNTVVEEGKTLSFRVYFSDETQMGTVNMVSNHVALVGFTGNTSVSGTGNTRTVTISNIKDETGTNMITIRAGAAVDAAGNRTGVTTISGFSIVEPKDTTKPSVVISAPSATTVVEGGTITYKVTFADETAMGTVKLNKDYVAPVGFNANISVSGNTVTLANIQGAAGTGKYITIRAGAAVDAAGNATAVTSSSTFAIKAKDTTRPSVVISKPNPTVIEVGGKVEYKVTFSDETAMGKVNFNKDYVYTSGFSADISVSGNIVTLTNIQGAADSDNKIIIRAGAAVDAAGNKTVVVESSEFTIKEIIKDITVPSMVISNPSPMVIKSGETVTYTVIFSDETAMGTANLNKDYVVPMGFDADITVTGTGNTRVITLSNVVSDADSSNYIIIRAGAAVDAAGNKTLVAESSNFSVTLPEIKDTTAPSIVISKPTPMVVEVGDKVEYTVIFSDETAMGKVNFNKDYVVPIGFNANIIVTGEGSRKTVTLTNIQGGIDSDNRIAIRAGAAVDAVGNKTPVVESSNFTVKAAAIKDTTAPSIVISKPAPMTVEVGDTVKYIITFSDETAMGTVNFNKDYVVPIGFNANIIVTGEGNRKTVTLTNIQGGIDSDNRIAIRAGAAVDAAGNKTPVVESSNFTVKATEIKDSIAPIVKVESVKPSKVYANGTVKYTVTFSDNVAVTDVNLYANKITTVGFKADISVNVNGVKSAEIILKNIKGTIGNNKYIKIASGVALDAEGNRSVEVTSMKFNIINKSISTNKTPIKTVYTANCIDDLELLGDINKEITYFASWLRSEKDTAIYPQENNYIVEDDTITYIIEYFNGSTATAQGVKFELTIPYKVEVEEINGGGKIAKQADNETVIIWNMGDIKSYTESTGTGFCRLYVKVRFDENKALKESKNISEVFYATLKTTADGNDSYSYMRQLFIDLTEGKTGTYNKYLTSIDSTNQVRPNDEITRAEFAKLLADSGIIEVEIGSKEYKKFKDYKTIPSYARDAVSALLKAGIIEEFQDGTFKPNNPILTEDIMQMLAQAAAYMSEQKLAVNKPVFLYKEVLTGKDGEISPKKDYIMELVRQNVIENTDAKPDTYALRKDVVTMVNSLTFRGPYVETLPENTLKFADIREDSVVFYNIVGAANSYTYTYDYRLWQQIIDVE